MEFHVLAVGDITGAGGLKSVKRHLRALKKLHHIEFCVVNGENASGVGITPQQADEILDAGADVITLGNHTWNRREICDYLEESRYILRPANFLPSLPGRGWGVYETQIGPVAVANLIGRCNMNFGPDNPFHVAEKILKDVGDIPLLLDFHAEATSERPGTAMLRPRTTPTLAAPALQTSWILLPTMPSRSPQVCITPWAA